MGCIGFDTKEKITGNFYLVAPDDQMELSLSYCDPAQKNICDVIVNATVFAVGYNKDYIIVQQHLRKFPDPANKNITNYFILPIENQNKKWGNYYGLIGPLTIEQFKEKKRELNIPDSLNFGVFKKNLD
jgi:hypothetical protein